MAKASVKEIPRSLSRQQLMAHTRELSRHVRKEQELQHTLFERDRQVTKLAAASRKALNASLVVQEEERQWIAFEVHDRIAQTLTAAFQQFQTLESMTSLEPQARQVMVRARMLLREAIRESRGIMNELHPPLLDESGVVPLMEEEMRHLQEDTGCQVRFDADYAARPPLHVEVALYRVFHEALNNVRRHAPDARNVGVVLTHRDGVVSLDVQDDGPGFDVQAATASLRVGGLMSMRRRTEIVGGAFTIKSRRGHGTQVVMRVPSNGVDHDKDGGR